MEIHLTISALTRETEDAAWGSRTIASASIDVDELLDLDPAAIKGAIADLNNDAQPDPDRPTKQPH